ncbi:MAG TPA: hypothetical protein VGF00_13305, partial [Acidimicrobiia bacterium]
MARVLLLLPTGTYKAPDFLEAARRLDVDVVVASETAQTLADAMGDRALVVDLADPEASAAAINALAARYPLDAVVGVDDQGVMIAALAGERLGLAHNAPEAVARTRNKAAMRTALAAADGRPRHTDLPATAPDDATAVAAAHRGQTDLRAAAPDGGTAEGDGILRQPAFRVVGRGGDVVAAAEAVGWPVVVKPVSLSASRGVIRADDPAAAEAAAARVWAILD